MTIEDRLIEAGFTRNDNSTWSRGDTEITDFFLGNLTSEELNVVLEGVERRKLDCRSGGRL